MNEKEKVYILQTIILFLCITSAILISISLKWSNKNIFHLLNGKCIGKITIEKVSQQAILLSYINIGKKESKKAFLLFPFQFHIVLVRKEAPQTFFLFSLRIWDQSDDDSEFVTPTIFISRYWCLYEDEKLGKVWRQKFCVFCKQKFVFYRKFLLYFLTESF